MTRRLGPAEMERRIEISIVPLCLGHFNVEEFQERNQKGGGLAVTLRLQKLRGRHGVRKLRWPCMRNHQPYIDRLTCGY